MMREFSMSISILLFAFLLSVLACRGWFVQADGIHSFASSFAFIGFDIREKGRERIVQICSKFEPCMVRNINCV